MQDMLVIFAANKIKGLATYYEGHTVCIRLELQATFVQSHDKLVASVDLENGISSKNYSRLFAYSILGKLLNF